MIGRRSHYYKQCPSDHTGQKTVQRHQPLALLSRPSNPLISPTFLWDPTSSGLCNPCLGCFAEHHTHFSSPFIRSLVKIFLSVVLGNIQKNLLKRWSHKRHQFHPRILSFLTGWRLGSFPFALGKRRYRSVFADYFTLLSQQTFHNKTLHLFPPEGGNHEGGWDSYIILFLLSLKKKKWFPGCLWQNLTIWKVKKKLEAVLVQDLGSVPSFHVVAHNRLWRPLLASMGIACMWCTDMYKHSPPTHIE